MRAPSPVWASLGPFALAVAIFLGFALPMSERMMVFSEEFITLPTPPRRVFAGRPEADGRPRELPTCHAGQPPRLQLSGERPTLSVCVGARRFPIMAAPQFAGFFLWPLELFRSLHHDDPRLIRKGLLVLGVLALALGYRLVARFGGRRLAAFAALGTAVSSCFVCLSSIIQPFETLPWILLLGALLALSGCPQLAPGADAPPGPPPTARLVLAAACVGLALVANVKALFLLAPLAVLALRLGVRHAAIRPRQWALSAAIIAAALLPMLVPVVMDPSMSWAQGRGSNWTQDLVTNLQRPQKVLEAFRDLVLMGANFGSYLTGEPPTLPSVVLMGVVVVFVLADTVRTLVRRRGCVVTAACGMSMLSYLGVVTLLYVEFPANYTPLHGVYGLALGCTVDRFAGWLQARSPRAPAVLLAATLLLPFAWNTVLSIRSFSEIPFVTNFRAAGDLVRYLEAHPEPRGVTVTVNLLLGGVPDALSGGRIETLQAHAWLGPCERREAPGGTAQCLYDRWSALLRREAPGHVVRVIMPASLAFVHRPPSLLPMQLAEFARAAQDLGLSWRLERTFHTPSGVPAAQLYRLAPR